MRRIVSFPHMGDYWIGIKALGELLDCDVFVPPPITKRTLELGTKHSPEFVCIPFKYNLGNFIESLDRGANFLVQCGGGCRFGYYGEVQEAILRDMGYDFEFVRMMGNIHPVKMYRDFHRINPDLKFWPFLKRFWFAISMGRALDEVDDFIRKNIGFEVEPGRFDEIAKRMRVEMDETRDLATLKKIHKRALADCAAVPVDKPKRPLRVGVVGELYVLMEPYSNYFLEEELGRSGRRGPPLHHHHEYDHRRAEHALPARHAEACGPLPEVPHRRRRHGVGRADQQAHEGRLRRDGASQAVRLHARGERHVGPAADIARAHVPDPVPVLRLPDLRDRAAHPAGGLLRHA